jgi:hypothetical protein
MQGENRSMNALKLIRGCTVSVFLLQACHRPTRAPVRELTPSYDLKEDAGRIEQLYFVDYSLHDALALIAQHLRAELIYREDSEAAARKLILNTTIQPMTWRDALISLVIVNRFKLEQTTPHTFVIYPPKSSHETKLPEEFDPVPVPAN